MRKKALSWAGDTGADLGDLAALVTDTSNEEMKDQLIFVYSQRHEPRRWKNLIDIAKHEQPGLLWKKAVFWRPVARPARLPSVARHHQRMHPPRQPPPRPPRLGRRRWPQPRRSRRGRCVRRGDLVRRALQTPRSQATPQRHPVGLPRREVAASKWTVTSTMATTTGAPATRDRSRDAAGAWRPGHRAPRRGRGDLAPRSGATDLAQSGPRGRRLPPRPGDESGGDVGGRAIFAATPPTASRPGRTCCTWHATPRSPERARRSAVFWVLRRPKQPPLGGSTRWWARPTSIATCASRRCSRCRSVPGGRPGPHPDRENRCESRDPAPRDLLARPVRATDGPWRSSKTC